jgi:hypothetical protein
VSSDRRRVSWAFYVVLAIVVFVGLILILTNTLEAR